MRVFLALAIIVITGCATQRPMLYPNEYLRRVGSGAADRDIDDCMRQAAESRPAAAGDVGVPSSPGAAISGLFGKPELSPGQKVFVNQCLRDKGYDPVGWN